MGENLSWVLAWQSVVPIFMGILSVTMMNTMMKWMSNLWAEAASQRAARVVARMGPRRPGAPRR